MIVNLGVPYEAKLAKIIEKGYAGNMTEAIRQSITSYYRELEDEENRLVGIGVEEAMGKIRSGKMKTHPAEEVFKKAGLK